MLCREDFLSSYENSSAVSKNNFVMNFFPILYDDVLAEDYAYLVGKIMGDGNLDRVFTMRFIGNEEDMQVLKEFITSKFKISPLRFSIRRRVNKEVSYLLQVNCAFLGRILFLLGAPRGNKTLTDFSVPSWILKRKRCTRRFLQAILEDELSTIKIEKCNYAVSPILKMNKKEELIVNHKKFMEQVKNAIESFGVTCGGISKPIKCEYSVALYFHIDRNKSNIIRFKEKIGFRLNKDKIRNLEDCYAVLIQSNR